MTLMKRNGNLLNSFPALFDDFFNHDLFNRGQSNFSDANTTIPAVSIKGSNDNYEVEVAAPGMTRKDFKVELDGSEKVMKNKEMKKEIIPAKNLAIDLF
ncbi:MAG: hypothetical protein ABJA71_09340 [Ginsengibacter sp.]